MAVHRRHCLTMTTRTGPQPTKLLCPYDRVRCGPLAAAPPHTIVDLQQSDSPRRVAGNCRCCTKFQSWLCTRPQSTIPVGLRLARMVERTQTTRYTSTLHLTVLEVQVWRQARHRSRGSGILNRSSGGYRRFAHSVSQAPAYS